MTGKYRNAEDDVLKFDNLSILTQKDTRKYKFYYRPHQLENKHYTTSKSGAVSNDFLKIKPLVISSVSIPILASSNFLIG